MTSQTTSARTGASACLVGPYPPPSGGVSMHIERLYSALTVQGVSVTVLDHFSRGAQAAHVVGLRKNPVRYTREIRRRTSDLTHYHHSRLDTLVAAASGLSVRSGHRVVTLHSHRIEQELGSSAPGVRAATTWALRRFDTVIAVSDAIAAIVSPVLRDGQRLEVVPAYLPAARPSTVDPEPAVLPTLVVSAYQLGHDAESDIYGLTLACETFRYLASQGTDWSLEIFLAQAPRSRAQATYLKRLRQLLATSAAPERGTIHIGAPLVPALRRNTVYLRPTLTDGDAVSVREALDLSVPVLASDVADRPPGVSVVTSRSPDAWAAEVRRVASLTRNDSPSSRVLSDPVSRLLDVLLPLPTETS